MQVSTLQRSGFDRPLQKLTCLGRNVFSCIYYISFLGRPWLLKQRFHHITRGSVVYAWVQIDMVIFNLLSVSRVSERSLRPLGDPPQSLQPFLT